MDIALSAPQRTHYRVDGVYLLPQLGREHGVYGSPGKAYANSVPGEHPLYTGGQHTLLLYTSCATPVGQACCTCNMTPFIFLIDSLIKTTLASRMEFIVTKTCAWHLTDSFKNTLAS